MHLLGCTILRIIKSTLRGGNLAGGLDRKGPSPASSVTGGINQIRFSQLCASIRRPPKGGLLKRKIKGSTLLIKGEIGLGLASLRWLSPEAQQSRVTTGVDVRSQASAV